MPGNSIMGVYTSKIYHLDKDNIRVFCGKEKDSVFILKFLSTKLEGRFLPLKGTERWSKNLEICKNCVKNFMAKDNKTDVHIKRDTFTFCGRSLNKRKAVEQQNAAFGTCGSCKSAFKKFKNNLEISQ